MAHVKSRASFLFLSLVAASAVGCSKSRASERFVIQVEGSDTMVNVAQAWAERYHEEIPNV